MWQQAHGLDVFALGRPGSGSAIQRGADVGGVVVAVAAAGRGAV